MQYIYSYKQYTIEYNILIHIIKNFYINIYKNFDRIRKKDLKINLIYYKQLKNIKTQQKYFQDEINIIYSDTNIIIKNMKLRIINSIYINGNNIDININKFNLYNY
jgi:hypothetical protein